MLSFVNTASNNLKHGGRQLPGFILVCVFCLVHISGGHLALFAQATDPPQGSTLSTPATVTLPAKPALKGDIIYLPNKQGELVAVPYNTNLEKYLDYLDQSTEKNTTEKNLYSINTLKLDGTVTKEVNSDEYLELKAIVEFNLLTSDWVEIPLRFLEASVIDSPIHTGPGEVIFKERDRTQGQQWYAKGQGLHTLSMTMLVPVRKQFASRRIQLLVPEALRNELNVEFPYSKISLKSNDDAKILKNQLLNNKTRVSLVGFLDRIDLNWTVESTNSQTQKSLESDLSMTLLEDPQGFLINAQQQIINLSGDVKQLNIQLPRDWEFVKVEGDGLVSQLIKQNKKERDLVTLNFSSSLSETTLLRWQFRLLNKQIGDKIYLDGLKVQGATRETGVVRLERTSSRRMIPVNYDQQVVVPVSVDTLLDSRNLVGAFRLNSQPFSLNFDIIQIQPYFSVEPEYRLIMSESECELQGRFLINVYRGSLSNMTIDWPGLDIGVRTTDITSPTNLVRNISWPDSTNDSRINVEFVEGQTKQCELFLRSQFEYISNQEPFSYSLPQANAPILTPAKLVILNAKNIETQIEPLADTMLTPLELLQPLAPFPGFVSSNINLQSETQQYRIKGKQWNILCNVRSFEQEISTSAHVTTRVMSSDIQIQQHITNNIKHEPLRHLELKIPASAMDLQIKVEHNQTEVKNFISIFQSGNQDLSLEFKTPITGLCEIHASYRLGNNNKPDTPFNLPIITCRDKSYSTLTYRSLNTAEGSLIPSSTEWKSMPDKLPTVYNYVSGIPDLESIKVQLKLQDQFTNIDNAYSLILVKKDSPTVLQGMAVYRFDNLPEILEFELKDNTWIKSTVYWNQAPVRYEFLEGASPRRLVIHIPKLPSTGPYQLLIPYESQVSENTWGKYLGASCFNQLVLNAPRLTKGAWVRNTIWEINLASNDILFETSSLADSSNNWYWNWFGISLQANVSQTGEWASLMLKISESPNSKLLDQRPTYRFHTQGPSAEISLITANWMFIVTTGLVLGLCLAFFSLNTDKVIASRVLLFASLILISGYLYMPTGMILWGQYILIGITLSLVSFYLDDIQLKTHRKRPVIVFSSDASSLHTISASPITNDSEATRLHHPVAAVSTSSRGLTGVNS